MLSGGFGAMGYGGGEDFGCGVDGEGFFCAGDGGVEELAAEMFGAFGKEKDDV